MAQGAATATDTFDKFYQTLKFIGNEPVIVRPPPHIPGTPVDVAFGPVLKKRKDRAYTFQQLQEVWSQYGRHRTEQFVMMRALRDSAITSRELDMLILAKHGNTIFGDLRKSWIQGVSSSFGSGPGNLPSSSAKAEAGRFNPRESIRMAFDPTHDNIDIARFRALSHEQRVALAASLVKDSMLRRQPKPRQGFERTVFNLEHSKIYRGVVLFVALLLCMLSFFEPPTISPSDPSRSLLATLEWLCLGVLGVSVLVRLVAQRVTALKDGWVVLTLSVVTLLILDAITRLSSDNAVYLTRPLRALVLIPLLPQLRRLSLTLIAGITNGFWLFVLTFALLITFALVAINITVNQGAFAAGLGPTMLSLFVTMTTGDLRVIAPMLRESKVAVPLFFTAFMIIMALIIMTLLFGNMYRTYVLRVRANAVRVRVQERRALTAAFALLDNQQGERLGFLNIESFLNLLYEVYAEPPAVTEVEALFAQIDNDSNRLIDILEFFQLCDVLFLRFATSASLRSTTTRFPKLWQAIDNARHSIRIPPPIAKLARSSAFSAAVALVVLAHAAAIFVFALSEASVASPALQTITLAFTLIYVLELVVKLAGLGIADFWFSLQHRADLAIVSALGFGLILGAAGAANAAAVLSTLALFRLMTTLPPLRRFAYSVAFISAPVMAPLLLLAIIAYIYAGIGVLLFGPSFSVSVAGGQVASFSTYAWAMYTVIQVPILATWQPLLAEALDVSATAAVAFFVSLTVLSVLLALNILLAIVVVMFNLRIETRAAHPDRLLEAVDPDIPDLFQQAKARPLPDIPAAAKEREVFTRRTRHYSFAEYTSNAGYNSDAGYDSGVDVIPRAPRAPVPKREADPEAWEDEGEAERPIARKKSKKKPKKPKTATAGASIPTLHVEDTDMHAGLRETVAYDPGIKAEDAPPGAADDDDRAMDEFLRETRVFDPDIAHDTVD